MNFYTILGLILVALGTVLMTYGGVFQARTDGKSSEEKLDKISHDLADLRGKPKTELSEDAITRVEHDVEEWAKDFASDKQRRKLVIDQKRSDHDNIAEHTASLGRDYFAFALSVMRDALHSYSERSSVPITVNLPQVSDRLFADADVRYEGDVVFSRTHRWQIITLTTHDSNDVAPPMIIIRLINGISGREKGEFMLRFAADMKTFFIRFQQDFQLALSMDSTHKPITEYEPMTKSLLLKLIEFQLLQE
jgi:hypothetical protein